MAYKSMWGAADLCAPVIQGSGRMHGWGWVEPGILGADGAS